MMFFKVCYLQVISPFSQYFVFYNDLDSEIWRPLGKHIQIIVIKIASCGYLYFWSYTPSEIGLVASLETSLKQMLQVKTS
jgi:hypothetical protein